MASSVEMLSGRRKKDYAAETAAQALETQAEVMGLDPVGRDDAEGDGSVALEADQPAPAEADAVAAWRLLLPAAGAVPLRRRPHSACL